MSGLQLCLVRQADATRVARAEIRPGRVSYFKGWTGNLHAIHVSGPEHLLRFVADLERVGIEVTSDDGIEVEGRFIRPGEPFWFQDYPVHITCNLEAYFLVRLGRTEAFFETFRSFVDQIRSVISSHHYVPDGWGRARAVYGRAQRQLAAVSETRDEPASVHLLDWNPHPSGQGDGPLKSKGFFRPTSVAAWADQEAYEQILDRLDQVFERNVDRWLSEGRGKYVALQDDQVLFGIDAASLERRVDLQRPFLISPVRRPPDVGAE